MTAVKIILLIGRIACGKTTYARTLQGTLLLSCDEVMQTLFPGGCGDRHDLYARRTRQSLYVLARRCAEAGVTPVLDFGFWTPAMRREAAEALSGFTLDWRYLDIPETEWQRRIAARNAAVLAGSADPSAYYVDEGLLAKVCSLFVPPTREELPGLIILQ